jgi:peptide deformylase
MAVMKIRTYPDPILRRRTKPVRTFDLKLRELVRDLFETMYHRNGLGLAANQVGVDAQVCVVDLRDGRNPPFAFINPAIVARSRTCTVSDEGCLSFPGYFDRVRRNRRVTVRYQDLNGEVREVELADLAARAVQHELDHLRGVVFVQRMAMPRRLRFRIARLLGRAKFPS